MLLLEKAWAKLYGSYQRIEAGTTGEALPALTGAPTEYILHREAKSNTNALWKKILQADKNKYVIATAASSAQSGKERAEMKRVGLVDAHAYSLISAMELSYGVSKVKLLKIRNPWGFKEWNGDWSDNSDKWTEDLKRQAKFVKADDGIFHISFDDYLEHFYITTICKAAETHHLSIKAD